MGEKPFHHLAEGDRVGHTQLAGNPGIVTLRNVSPRLGRQRPRPR